MSNSKLPFMSFLIFGLAAYAEAPPSTINAPFVETFQLGSKSLIYVGAVHHSPLIYPNAMTDPTFETIAKIFSDTPPDAVIVEGVDPSDLTGFLQFAQKCAIANYNIVGHTCDEPEFTAVQAKQIGADVYTGEPSGPSVLSYFESQGYSTQDVLAYYIMRMIPVRNNHVPLTTTTFSAFEQSVVKSSDKDLGITTVFTPDEFSDWYAQNMSNPVNYLDITTNDTGPASPGQTPTLLNTFSSVDTVMRDGNVVTTIQNVLATHTRVLIVYGASHLDFEWNQLEQLMGSPTYSKLY